MKWQPLLVFLLADYMRTSTPERLHFTLTTWMIDVFFTLILKKKTQKTDFFFFFFNSLNVKLHITTLSNEGGMKAPHMRGISLNLNMHPDFVKGSIAHPNFPVE